MNGISISPGNTKTGRIPAVSLPPCATCREDAPCRERCYALKAWRQYPGTRLAWNGNWAVYRADPWGYFAEIGRYVAAKAPRFFRFHVSGDCPTIDYARRVVALARAYPETRFLIFTKRFSWFSGRIPGNLSVVFSCWPGMPLPKSKRFPRAFMVPANGEEPSSYKRARAGALDCPGNCETCGACWLLRETGRNVAFLEH